MNHLLQERLHSKSAAVMVHHYAMLQSQKMVVARLNQQTEREEF